MLLYNEEAARKDPALNNGRPWQQCSLSVLDTIADPDISFDAQGISNYYAKYKKLEGELPCLQPDAEAQLAAVVNKIKETGKGKRYDCITGVSGGVDSTYLAWLSKQLGLRPLIVHFDNGWNSEMAVKNIENIISRLGFDLYTLVVDWEEFKDIQLAYIKASVVDIEAITDHAIIGTLFRLAAENDIKYILSGTNVVTEAVLPTHWIWNKYDHRNIQDIHKQYGTIPLKTYPFFSFAQKQKYIKLKKIESINLLNYISYNKTEVKETIKRELNWKDYGGKHYESVFTRFYQGYILPVKFGIDKRKAHLSNLVFSGQMTKEAAIAELQQPIYDPQQLQTDYDFVLKKFNLSPEQFEQILRTPRREHSEFAVEKSFWDNYPFLRPFKKLRHLVFRQ